MPALLALTVGLALSAAPTLQDLFAGRAGTIAMYETNGDRTSHVDPARAARRFTPCSTFKIPNALIALEAGSITLADSRIAWDPARDPKQDYWPAGWAADHDLASAIRGSVLWYFRELARRTGPERMARALARIRYGNEDISGGLDRFWIESSLRISADEQLDFIRRFAAGRLGFPEEATRAVKEAIVLERGDDFVWRGKTGGCESAEGRWIGWLVGYLERGPDTVYYAMNLDGASYQEIAAPRREITREALRRLGYLPQAGPAPAGTTPR